MKLINPEVRVENTNYCIMNCIMCDHDKMTRPKGGMKRLLFMKIVCEAKRLGAQLISIFGYGEPLLDSILDERIAFCTNMGLGTFITTNGTLAIEDKIKGLFDAGLKHIRFSVHALDKENYERIHIGGNFLKAIDNITQAGAIRDAYGYETVISLVAIPMNGESVKEIRAFWEDIVDYLEIWKPHNWASKMNYRNSTEKRLKTCGRPHTGPVQIQWDGTVIPCCFLTNNELTLGNVEENTIEQILKAEPYQILRDKHESGDLRSLPCETCDQLNIEDESPLLYSNRDKNRDINRTSSTKFKLL